MSEKEFQDSLEKKMKEYEEILYQKNKEGLLQTNTLKTYLTHSTNFVRWCKGDFIPGGKNQK